MRFEECDMCHTKAVVQQEVSLSVIHHKNLMINTEYELCEKCCLKLVKFIEEGGK